MQALFEKKSWDCFVTPLLAMTQIPTLNNKHILV
jgi:hypothetical protein